MSKIIVFWVLLIFCFTTTFVHTQNSDFEEYPQPENGALKFVMIVTRHGARSPTTPRPTNSTIHFNAWDIYIKETTLKAETDNTTFSVSSSAKSTSTAASCRQHTTRKSSWSWALTLTELSRARTQNCLATTRSAASRTSTTTRRQMQCLRSTSTA